MAPAGLGACPSRSRDPRELSPGVQRAGTAARPKGDDGNGLMITGAIET